ncbi:hypothetical protein G6F64_015101 [Rhizopus arrhizus]|uniref:Uncharacterized protein n=1 Tax=Rhizopus oryzae TaxID=64495 RepID=A0A9P6WS66_RHIOR|nr:hypothetical protein G6F64_015101 [Rhizopus arrhizus]
MHVAMEGLVGVDELLVFAIGMADPLQVDAGLQALVQHRVGPLRQQVHDLQFQGLAQEMGLPGGRDIDAADDGGVLRIDLDQRFFGQAHEGVADGRLAQSVGFRQRDARYRGARGEFQRHDLFA